ncbi:Zinc finger C2H2 protein [Nosema granulosis]|uniref:Zinc finger C2H2 protein n=1 Tax=Nosema granulosis TaxID=83296 RepID=A0A9P6H1M0_9MICR|nr:Zinc finger C2H2 protein [Nosema granulosis]
MDCKWKGCGEKDVEDMSNHIKIHIRDQKDNVCLWEGCSRYSEANASRGGFYTHCKSHTGDRNYKCTICNIDFSSVNVYYRHKRKHTVLEKKEETSIAKISLLGHLLDFHKQRTVDLLEDLAFKKANLKFINGEIIEVIKKYIKGKNLYSDAKFWNEYL